MASCKQAPWTHASVLRLPADTRLQGLSGTATTSHSSELPAACTREQAIAMLQDHHFFLECDPLMSKIEVLESPPDDGNKSPDIPESVKAVAVPGRPMRYYRVTDVVHTIPAGIWDSNVVSVYEFVDIESGVWVRIKSPLSVSMDTAWEIRPVPGTAADDAPAAQQRLEIFEDVNISCSRLLLGLVKAQCENNWQGIHSKMLERLNREIEERKDKTPQDPSTS